MLTLALLATLLPGGEGEVSVTHRIPPAAKGDVMQFDWEDSAGRSTMHYRLERVGLGLRYLDLGVGYETWTVVPMADRDDDIAE